MGYIYEFTGKSLIFLRENDSLSSKVLGESPFIDELSWKRPKHLVGKLGDSFRTDVNPYDIAYHEWVTTKWKLPMFFMGLSFVVFLPLTLDLSVCSDK